MVASFLHMDLGLYAVFSLILEFFDTPITCLLKHELISHLISLKFLTKYVFNYISFKII